LSRQSIEYTYLFQWQRGKRAIEQRFKGNMMDNIGLFGFVNSSELSDRSDLFQWRIALPLEAQRYKFEAFRQYSFSVLIDSGSDDDLIAVPLRRPRETQAM